VSYRVDLDVMAKKNILLLPGMKPQMSSLEEMSYTNISLLR